MASSISSVAMRSLVRRQDLGSLRSTVSAALSGITSGALLAVARIAGETAPLLFTILGGLTTTNANVFSGANTALPLLIFVNASSPYTGAQGRAWGAALTLIVIALIMLVVARLVTGRVAARSSR